jgi:hypothetical protein
MAQCFCRASAVHSGTFVLGHGLGNCSRLPQQETDENNAASNWSISLQGIEGETKVESIVGDRDVLHRILANDERERSRPVPLRTTGVSAILLLDRGVSFEGPTPEADDTKTTTTPPETGLVIFPPGQGKNIGAVTALQMAEGTFSCPKGMYLVYLSASVTAHANDQIVAKEELKDARDEVLKLASKSASEWKEEEANVETGLEDAKTILPLMEVYYSSVAYEEGQSKQGDHRWGATSTMSSIATSLDEATDQAEELFWSIMGEEKRGEAEEARRRKKPIGYTVGRGLGGVLEGKESDNFVDFFPPEDTSLGDDDE